MFQICVMRLQICVVKLQIYVLWGFRCVFWGFIYKYVFWGFWYVLKHQICVLRLQISVLGLQICVQKLQIYMCSEALDICFEALDMYSEASDMFVLRLEICVWKLEICVRRPQIRDRWLQQTAGSEGRWRPLMLGKPKHEWLMDHTAADNWALTGPLYTCWGARLTGYIVWRLATKDINFVHLQTCACTCGTHIFMFQRSLHMPGTSLLQCV